MDILGRAIAEYYFDNAHYKLWVHDNHGPRVEMQVPIYFRSPEAMPDLEMIALHECSGKVLDIGAGAGSHALYLQERGLDVTALDISAGAASVARARGVQNVLEADIFTLKGKKFDTLLLLMNGIGLVQNIEGLKTFLHHAKTLLKAGGQLLFDSSDLAYLYEDGIPELPYYYGEVQCCYEYRRKKSDWFSWLYIDPKTMEAIAAREGWNMNILCTDASDQYLARLTLKR
ncbi:MAG TPA: class I SAM-dependent methyltransferase [Chitinophagaceae bacterium]|nr:class I SAM-dependent methyltransferase [Chitinophagaceae bacterium]